MGQKYISSVQGRVGSTGAVRTVGYGACIPMHFSEGRTVLGDGIGWALCCHQTLAAMDQRPTLSGLYKGASIGKEKGNITSENLGSEIESLNRKRRASSQVLRKRKHTDNMAVKNDTEWKPGSFADDDGHFRRPEAKIRNFVSADPDSDFPAEANRYVLYVHYACPWAHRIVIVRVLKGLEDIIDVVELDKADDIGWAFSGTTGPDKDPRYGFTHLRDLYLKAFPDNNASEILEMVYSEFDAFIPEEKREATKAEAGFLPLSLKNELDTFRDFAYHNINDGVYKVGFASTQQAYEDSLFPLFEALDKVEEQLADTAHQPYLFGKNITDADIRLFSTLIRFDVSYFSSFKCNLKMIRYEYPRLHLWLRTLYWDPENKFNGAFRDTVRFQLYKEQYAFATHSLSTCVNELLFRNMEQHHRDAFLSVYIMTMAAFAAAVLGLLLLAICNLPGTMVFCVLYGFFTGTFISVPGSTTATLVPQARLTPPLSAPSPRPDQPPPQWCFDSITHDSPPYATHISLTFRDSVKAEYKAAPPYPTSPVFCALANPTKGATSNSTSCSAHRQERLQYLPAHTTATADPPAPHEHPNGSHSATPARPRCR
ncbi:hypothetical protein V498_05733 [Pseudogymnoascus sp. VKM F-4517 (FW-2822)]|nr:hypothetical protein V498_05733 [Pseudogymnoascus sp. VKM F-4517 (FW-2822)]